MNHNLHTAVVAASIFSSITGVFAVEPIRFSSALAMDSSVGWELCSATVATSNTSNSLPSLENVAAMRRVQAGGKWAASNSPGNAPAQWRVEGTKVTALPGAGGQFALAVYTVKEAGFYAVEDSSLLRSANVPGRVELRVFVQRANAANSESHPCVFTTLDAGELFDFDTFLGFLDAGDRVIIALGPDGEATGDDTELEFTMTRTPELPVSVLGEDIGVTNAVAAPGGWAVLTNVPQGSVAARLLGWNSTGASAVNLFRRVGKNIQLELLAHNKSLPRETIVAFRVPQSGFYALQNAWAIPANNAAVEARVYVGTETSPRRITPLAGRTGLNTEIGYVARGEVIYLAFAPANGAARVDLNLTVVEWSPRRAPLRVRRGADGLLDVFEPADVRRAVDIPAERWVEIPFQTNDATAAIRAAIAKAHSLRSDREYAGVRFENGKTYTVASAVADRIAFPFQNLTNLVFDGNGATLFVGSREVERADVSLFTVSNCQNIVLALFTVTAASIPFTTGEILEVNPPGASTQTLKVRMDAGALDPLRDIRHNGRGEAYAYDAKIPGRLAPGAWSHYPGNGEQQIEAVGTNRIYSHRVTRTMGSIQPGAKWLIKNKGGGVTYLTTRGGAENITLSGVDGRAAGGGTLRFWQTSGVNILDCRFEPEGEHWISSSADGIHGRGREGVWVENTLIRGVCEDVMNTYGQSMVAVADDNNADAELSIRMYERNAENTGKPLPLPTSDSISPGDQLVFFNPQTGKVLGYSTVRSASSGRYTLSARVAEIDFWEKGDGRTATMIYSTRSAGRFFVRDSRIMDSMRFGIYIKARGGVVFNTQLEGLSATGIFAVNEPEWPEGPPATHLWVQGCTFSQNNSGYMSAHRAFVVADPADISVYTRRLRGENEPEGFRTHLAQEEFANSHMKFVGNVFHDWRGMGIAVRNAHNVQIEGNLFLPPVNDDVLRKTLSADPALALDGRGTYAGIFLDSVSGVRVCGNRFHGLPTSDRAIALGQDVSSSIITDNCVSSSGTAATVAFSFDEWFGAISTESTTTGTVMDEIELGSATHRAGRLGAGLHFTGGAPAVLIPSADFASAGKFTIALWANPEATSDGEHILFAQGDAQNGAAIAIDHGRWVIGCWQDERGHWLDLGPAVNGMWQHVALSVDGGKEIRGYLNGTPVAVVNASFQANALPTTASIGGVIKPTLLSARSALHTAGYHGEVDEFRLVQGVLTSDEIHALALRREP